MTEFLEFLKGFNVQTILSVFAIVWYFSRQIENKMERHEQRTDRLYEMFIETLAGKKIDHINLSEKK